MVLSCLADATGKNKKVKISERGQAANTSIPRDDFICNLKVLLHSRRKKNLEVARSLLGVIYTDMFTIF